MKYHLLFLFVLIHVACGAQNQSAVEGKAVGWNGKPLAGVKIAVGMLQPIKGYEGFSCVTESDGTFRVSGLYPSSRHGLKAFSKDWESEAVLKFDSAPRGETAVLPTPLVVEAFSKIDGREVDPETGNPRFAVSSDGVIKDSKTSLEWVVGPDLSYPKAKQWISAYNVAGGGWRMPTRQDLRTLCPNVVKEPSTEPDLKEVTDRLSVKGWGLGGWYVWAEPNEKKPDQAHAIFFHSSGTFDHWGSISDGYLAFGVMGVRSQQDSKQRIDGVDNHQPWDEKWLTEHAAAYQPLTGKDYKDVMWMVPEGKTPWLVKSDLDGDGQLDSALMAKDIAAGTPCMIVLASSAPNNCHIQPLWDGDFTLEVKNFSDWGAVVRAATQGGEPLDIEPTKPCVAVGELSSEYSFFVCWKDGKWCRLSTVQN